MQEHNQTTRELFNLDNGNRPKLSILSSNSLIRTTTGKSFSCWTNS